MSREDEIVDSWTLVSPFFDQRLFRKERLLTHPFAKMRLSRLTLPTYVVKMPTYVSKRPRIEWSRIVTRADDLQPLSKTQWEIMQIVWNLRETTVSHVWKRLSQQRNLARNTVLTQMDRLAKKGWLKRRADGNTYHYSAATTRKATLKDAARRLLIAAFGGDVDELVLTLLDNGNLSDEQSKRIREMIDEARRSKK